MAGEYLNNEREEEGMQRMEVIHHSEETQPSLIYVLGVANGSWMMTYQRWCSRQGPSWRGSRSPQACWALCSSASSCAR